jgi:hypothetical protein
MRGTLLLWQEPPLRLFIHGMARNRGTPDSDFEIAENAAKYAPEGCR